MEVPRYRHINLLFAIIKVNFLINFTRESAGPLLENAF